MINIIDALLERIGLCRRGCLDYYKADVALKHERIRTLQQRLDEAEAELNRILDVFHEHNPQLSLRDPLDEYARSLVADLADCKDRMRSAYFRLNQISGYTNIVHDRVINAMTTLLKQADADE